MNERSTRCDGITTYKGRDEVGYRDEYIVSSCKELKGSAHSKYEHWTSVFFFCKLLLNGASHDTKIGCISLVSAGAKKYRFSFLLCPGP